MEKPVMVIGLDESDHSFYALEWTIKHFFSSPENPPFKLVIVRAKKSAVSAIGVAGLGTADVLPHIDKDLKAIASRTLDKAKEVCSAHSINDGVYQTVEGDPRNVLCDVAEKHHATVLVLGSHGYGAIKRAVLGSVSDYCSHHAHCSVMIVKRPKVKD